MQITLGNYYAGDSLLHRLDPRLKLLSSLVLMILIFFLNTPLSLGLYALLLLGLSILSRIPLKKILRSVRSILFLAGFAFVLNLFTVRGEVLWSLGFLSITREGLYLGIKLALRLFFLVITTSLLLTLVTTPLALSDALERLLSPLARIRFPAHELAMMMSIALRFVPTLADETDKIMKAQSSRGADFDTGGLFARLRGLVTVLIPLFVSAFKRAEDLAMAMEARCYRGGTGRTKLHVLRFERRDAWMTLAFVLTCAVLLLVEYLPRYL